MLTFAQFQKLHEDKMLVVKKVPTLLPKMPNLVDSHRAARAKWQGELRTRPKLQRKTAGGESKGGRRSKRRMTNEEAWTILEDALNRCREGVQTEAVYQALKHLSRQARPVPGAKGVYFPFHNFWKCMAAPRGPMGPDEGRWQQAIAAMRGMRLRVPGS